MKVTVSIALTLYPLTTPMFQFFALGVKFRARFTTELAKDQTF